MAKPSEIYGKPWSEREYIVVLYFYLIHRHEPRHEGCRYIQELAGMLGRVPSAVVMRLENFASLDPELTRSGLKHIGPLGERVFKQWFSKPDTLRDCAEVLIREAQSAAQPTLFDPDPVRMPHAFGKYELLDLIGDGGFGSVYSCVHSDTGKRFAMKIIKTDKIYDKEVIGRFRREIKTLKTLAHPNVIRIHEDNLDEQDEFPAFIMDLAESSLADFIQERLGRNQSGAARPLLPSREAAVILGAVMDGVQALHENEKALIHRDLNPNNILRLPDGRWVLADFSLAKFIPTAVVTTSFATASHMAWGTDSYTAPEQWQDFKRADHRADIYGLGVLTWELFSPSWPPFDRSCTLLPEELKRLVLRATERNRDDRHPTVAELKAEFLSHLDLPENA